MLSVKQGGIKYHFGVFGMTQPGIETQSPVPLANTLTKQKTPKKNKQSTLQKAKQTIKLMKQLQ